MNRHAIIVGGGIGGLATARSLTERGWNVEVFERAAELREVGAGISVWPNGVRAMQALGLGEQILAHAAPRANTGIRDWSGRWLQRTDTAELVRRYGPYSMVHRQDLLDILHAAVPKDCVRLNVEVKEVRPVHDRVEVIHTSGVSEADLVVGADGIWSAVRRSMWPEAAAPQYKGYTAWRFVATLENQLDIGSESWGRGERVGFGSMTGNRVFAYLIANMPEGQCTRRGELQELKRRFGSWHEPIPMLLDTLSEADVLRHDIYDLPPLDSFTRGRVALLGDAAHAMTPHLGQGVNQTLEDAVTLGVTLERHQKIEDALLAYDAQRRPRSQRIVARSHQMGLIGQWTWAPFIAFRDNLTFLTPDSLAIDTMRPNFDWQPPQ